MIGHDIRYSIRTLLERRGFTAVAVLTLAIALAANTAIFSVVNAILLRPLPFATPDRLLNLTGISRIDGGTTAVYSYPNYADVRAEAKTLSEVTAFVRTRAFLMEGDDPELMWGLRITANLPQLTGVSPQLGRFFTSEEDREGGAEVIVISHDLWQRRFQGDRSIIGRAIRFGTAGQLRTVIGVMPPGFRMPVDEDVRQFMIPFEQDVGEARTQRDAIWINVVARAREGATLEQVNAELDTISKRLAAQYPEANTGLRFVASSMHEDVVREVRPALLLLFGAVAVVLLIGCANVANLLLARATVRHKEISVRAALGASPGRITVQLLVESLVIAIAAGAVGLLLAAWGIDALLAFAPSEIPRLDAVAMDTRVLLFAAGLSIVTGFAFGLAPAISASRPNLTNALKEGTRGSTEGKRNRLRSILVVFAVALSLMLLAGAGLLLRSFIHVSALDPGYDHRNATALTISARNLAYPDTPKMMAFHERLMSEIRTLPGVTSVGAVDTVPLAPQESVYSFNIVGRPPAPPGQSPSSKVLVATPGLFETLRIRLVKGREILATDRANTQPVVVVNEAFVRQFLPNENPIGKKLEYAPDDVVEIVGVVGDARWRSLTAEPPPIMFQAHAQRARRTMSYVVRAANGETLAPSLRALVRRLDPQQPIMDIQPLAASRAESLATRRFNLMLLAALAVVALVLAAVGIFSVMSYSVTQRTSEIGIRMALGAGTNDVFRLIVGHAVRLVAAGTAIGVAGALLSSRAMESLLYGVRPADPWTFAAIVIVIAGTALLASYLPARRAARVDPLVAIRYD